MQRTTQRSRYPLQVTRTDVEEPFDGEERLLIPNPMLPTYDLAPEMYLSSVTLAVVK